MGVCPKMVAANSGVIEVFEYIVTVLMILSIVGAFCVIVTFGINPRGRLRTYPIKLIMYLCVCIVIGFTAFLIAFEPYIYTNEPMCIIIAIFVHYYFIANFLWTFCIAFNFYQMIVRRNRQAQHLEKYFHVACWGIPAILCIFTGGFNQYGDLGGACYIKSALVRFLCFFIPGLIIISCNAILFFSVGREIHETLSSASTSSDSGRPFDKEKLKTLKKEFRVYLSIFVSIGLSWIFGYLMFLLPFPIVSDIFFILFSIFAPLQGLLIFVFYILNRKVIAAWVSLIGVLPCCPCCGDLAAKIEPENTTNSNSNSSNRSRGSASSASSGSSMSDSGAL